MPELQGQVPTSESGERWRAIAVFSNGGYSFPSLSQKPSLILLANSNQWYFNNLVKKPCHKTHCRCPYRLNLSFQSSRSYALPNIKALKEKDLEFANSIREGCETSLYYYQNPSLLFG